MRRPDNDVYDVAVVGGGNAGVCAALAARDEGAHVLLLERADEVWRGGNSKYTRNIRCASFDDSYPVDELLGDLADVGDIANRSLATLIAEESRTIGRWMEAHGALWQPPLSGTLQLERTNRFFLGGGKALLNKYYQTAHNMGIQVLYSHQVESVSLSRPGIVRLEVTTLGSTKTVAARTAIIAAGGFESNRAWLSKQWGPEAVKNFIIRGTSLNDGKMLRVLATLGAKIVGNERSFHSVAVDARAPAYDGGIVTRVDSIPFGIVVNKHGLRFYDEGEDIWPKRYAIWGRLIAQQEDQIAYSIFDSQTIGRFIPPLFEPVCAESVDQLAGELRLDPKRLAKTISTYNASIVRRDEVNGGSSVNLIPPKTRWATPIAAPPFYAYPLRPGITFTYLGVAVDNNMRVESASGETFERIWAAGEIMAGNVLSEGYLAGFGMTIGTISGRYAGRNAAIAAQRSESGG